MRRLVASMVAALALPACASAGVHVSAFYYVWYGTPTADGLYQHWNQYGHTAPDDIASSYYPARGLYSSTDKLVVGAQMDEIRGAGIDEVAVSWWGRGSPEDARLPAVATAARADGLRLAVHLEPYAGRTVAGTVADIAYLRTYGVRVFYVYRPDDLPAADWAAAKVALHAGGVKLFAQTAMAGWAAAAGFDGLYTYDTYTYGADKLGRICREAHAVRLLCAPSVGPGYDARRGNGDTKVRSRNNGLTYDHMWRAAIKAGADVVTITSYNEWHEGTQIEPAAPAGRHGRYRYVSYDGAWGLRGVAAEDAYLQRTAYWAAVYRRTLASQPKASAS